LWGDKTQDIYFKQHLTPFGEYIPLRSLAKKISPLVNQVDDFSPGKGQKTFIIGRSRVAPVICFELIDDEILAKAAKNSNILVVQTNSATFGTSAESAQQLSITRIRAIEHSRNIASVSTTGISAIIDFDGKVVRQTSMGTAGHLFASLGLVEQSSLRDRLGDWASVFTLIWLLVVARRAYTLRR
jgi:apolipoprotein N-acyltransferase